MHFTHILHYESLNEDWRYFLHDTKLPDSLNLPWENRGASRGKLKDYFEFVTEEEKEKLYLKFQADFEIFNYSIDDEF